MRLPGGADGVVEIAKLRDYRLNSSHPRGRHKARVFASVLGLTQAEAEFLREQLMQAAREGEAVSGEADEYGQRYAIDFELKRGLRQAMIRSFWIVWRSEFFPRLTTCYVLME